MMTIKALVFLIAVAVGLPQVEKIIDFRDERSVSSNIVDAIEDVCQTIKDVGLDPLYIEKQEVKYELPVPVIFNGAGLLEDVNSNGLSDVDVKKMSYSLVTNRLNFDIEIPKIVFGVGAASAKATFFSNRFNLESSGKIEIQRIRVVGHVRVSIGIISGITVRNVKITFTLGGIDSDVRLALQGQDYSDAVNKFFGITIPKTLKDHSDEINELLEILMKDLINEFLKKSKVIA
ncbi:unnamed protein product [Chrysodeixis includens]|uniref:Hemolymph juvenile hormone binding protein n=1 Tax=Chrysodeixis includens TaxID=689277 RepID=A0A9P0C264_CHRIL|nr:unnamed protein product [Chrysodeixis includens]